eukprot:436520-Prymnesium_polylepis.1
MRSGNALRRVYGCAVGRLRRPSDENAQLACCARGCPLLGGRCQIETSERRSPSGASENDQQRVGP